MMELKDKLAVARKPDKYLSELHRLWSSYHVFHEWFRQYSELETSEYNPYHTARYGELASFMAEIQEDAAGAKDRLYKAEMERRERAKLTKERRLRSDLEKFYNYQVGRLYGYDTDYLRLSQCGEYVETSQGVSVSVKAAKVLYQMIQAGRQIRGHNIEGYIVRSINGTLQIGCHNIDMESVHEVGSKI